ncbi:MAG: UvrD-helicase domain-containing protein [Myxococcota bacterium]|nr:UvrD-helicase domain-containing protein [Myxococcota bacterium]MDP6241695.1 UvrD-helicase domain-containing protein [Myxococcota bacterium]MDP7073836.1 UvrD-helicase domain-containing protein [Myxococcota bacterium]MDP7300348.1 UvrD-helicase domain-containing protein [Myxococcota bacterium]MDP7433371.1 UvrD-helicase domain-containing protein [Myxococcota bacterium]
MHDAAAALLAGLNPEQRVAVETTEGPLLVLAGAGSGKTRVLTHRIAYLIGVCGIAPESVLAVTFTNKAAGEMRERVEKLLGPGAEGVWLGTFHSTCVRILRRDIGHLGFSRGFAIYDQSDSLALVKEAVRRQGLDPKEVDPRRMEWRIDQWKNAGVGPGPAFDAAADFEAQRAAEVYATYQRLLVDANALDFGDLLLRTVELFERFPEVLRWYRQRWQYLLIDEYQDTNRVQYRLVQQLAAEHRNLCVVGDGDQSVYGWRGADIRNILDFEEDYPNANVVLLERNYRSVQPILEGASGVIAHNVGRKEKRLYTEREGGEKISVFEAADDREEAAFVVREILTAQRGADRSWGQFAIFYRTNAQSRVFEEELLKYNVPHVVVGGVRFYERAEVKDALAWLRLLVNPADAVAVRRVVARPTRGIGRTTLERASSLAAEHEETLVDGLRRFAEQGGARTAKSIRAFLALLERLRDELSGVSTAEALAAVLDRSGYLQALERDGSPEAEARLENLRELLSAADDFGRELAREPDASEERSETELFLDQVALVSDIDTWERRDECVSLMTVHTAKGLEFPIVFVVGLEEGVFPHAGALRNDGGIEEERRLCYVAMTRAMERLVLTSARERHRWGSRTYGIASRFLREIPDDALERPLAGGARVPGDSTLDYSYSQDAEGGDMDDALAPGLRVQHPTFGPGVVLQALGSGAGRKLRIRFERAGVKTIVVRYGNLEIG